MDRTELPIPDYDHLPEGSLAHRIRTLEAGDLEVLLDYERKHAARVSVMQIMQRRLEELRSGAAPSGGDPHAAQPEQAPAPAGGSPADPASAQETNQPLRVGVAGQTPNREIRGR